jgi:predicted helicase
LIQHYLADLSRLRQASGSQREGVVSEAFKDLLKGWGRQHDLILIPQYEIESPAKERRYVDGALVHALRVPFGYWEAKDDKDDLDAEIEFKFKRGYPQDNIIFEDSTKAVLIQNRREVIRCDIDDVPKLEKLLTLFFGYERPEISEFRKAVEQFKTDLPAVLDALRKMIELSQEENEKFRKASIKFLKHAQETINPGLTAADVREILIQHILTEEVFTAVFPNTSYHQDNNVARELVKLEATFFTGNTKFQTLKALEVYYAAIRRAATLISDHHQKQTFLKVIYENFYKVYNPKAADRLGVVYTPNEIVRFMIEGADWLCEKHFGRNLIDKDVEILDPATGTGTFICELLEHFRGQPSKLKHKYLEELHANEVAILPYYVANLNIEATYAAITGNYVEFPNLCFVDTLDNTAGLRKKTGDQIADLFGLGEENVERIKRQNRRKISVVIGNPPYNANQANENENNKNRVYPEIDKRIKETYIKASTAQKTKLYDMYARFFRWASDRLHDNGVLAFITNRSLLDSRTFDGFRSVIAEEFSEIHIVDLGGDVRANPKLSGTKNNVFGIQTGVTISFLVKRAKSKECRIYYSRRPELETAEDKLAWLSRTKFNALEHAEIRPDAKHNWLNLTDNDFESLLPIATKAAKLTTKASQEKVIFKLFSIGQATNRDDWVYDFDSSALLSRMKFFIDQYGRQDPREPYGASIKWSRNLKRSFAASKRESFNPDLVRRSIYRPYVRQFFYDSALFVDERGALDQIFPSQLTENVVIAMNSTNGVLWHCLAINTPIDLNAFYGGSRSFPQFRYSADGSRIDNVTDWALDQFRKHYTPGRGRKAQPITKEAIFHYVYAVLHDPLYREKYAQNLKREFPRIPLYPEFWQWASWGKMLINLHIGYEKVAPWPLKRVDIPDEKTRKNGGSPKAILKADKDAGRIVLDSETSLLGIPSEAWDYKLGNRCALEWILDQYKEKTPKDPTIRVRFNTYRFADHKDKVIDLLMRVTRVSVETEVVVKSMEVAPR